MLEQPVLTELLSVKSEQRVRFGIWALTIAAYALTLGGPFQFDDSAAILHDPAAQSLSAAIERLGLGLRPILDLSYALCWQLGAGASWPFHVVNVLLHLVNVELVLRLCSAMTDRSATWPFRGMSKASAIAAALFALHPIQTEAVTYISGRSSSLSTTFSFCTLLFYAAYARGRGRGYYVAAVGAFCLAVFTKELSVTIPLALVLWELFIERSKVRAIAFRLGPWLACWLAASVALVMHPRYFGLMMRIVGKRPVLDAAYNQVNGVAYLASKLVLFSGPCIDPGLGLQPSVGWVSWLAFVVLTGALAAVAWARRDLRRIVAFGVLYFLLQVWFPYVVLPRADVINERHAYAGTFAIFLIVGLLWQDFFHHGRYAVVVGLTVIAMVALVASTLVRNMEYGSELSLWQATTRCAPDNPRAFNNLGVAYEKEGALLQARAAYAKAITLSPRYAAARDNFIRASRKRSNAQQAHPKADAGL